MCAEPAAMVRPRAAARARPAAAVEPSVHPGAMIARAPVPGAGRCFFGGQETSKSGGGDGSFQPGIIVPDPCALLRLGGKLAIPGTEFAAGRIVAGAIDACTALHPGGSLPPQRLVNAQRPRRRGAVGTTQNRCQGDTALDALPGSLTAVGQHRMGGITEQAQPPAGPDRQWLAVI